MVALGSSVKEVKNITLTANKAAWIRIGASFLGGINLLASQEIEHIAQRLDEKYRQKFLKSEK
ncbi:MAG: hypothetical protein Kow00103_03030 [Candidatus Caldatribacteriota bacterium]